MPGKRVPAKRPLESDDESIDRPLVKRVSYNYNVTIPILVGPHETEFTVHKDVICARSRYFQAACSQNWRVGRDKITCIGLSDVEPATFQMYMDAMYNNLVYDEKASSRPLIKLYILGDFLDDVKLRNEAMELLLARERCPNFISIALLWSHTAPGCLAREWAVDNIISRLKSRRFARFIAKYPAEFVQEVAVKLHALAPCPKISNDYFEAESDDDSDA